MKHLSFMSVPEGLNAPTGRRLAGVRIATLCGLQSIRLIFIDNAGCRCSANGAVSMAKHSRRLFVRRILIGGVELFWKTALCLPG
ncbi:hypothetical protein [Burkholderia stabilis]|uniref:hypothetical protein n=1 Tax=Burkholderia stabilis TaxID=95485 RepID=UPI001F4B4C67|nr:hypothetical protein [Burkholderia stabilis]